MLLLLLSCFDVLVACVSQDSCLQTQQPDMMLSLLQSRLSLQDDTELEKESGEDSKVDLPKLQPVGRSFYSSDPDASANFVNRYLNSNPEANGDMFVSAPGAKAAGTYLSGWRYRFIQGNDPVMESTAREFEDTWEAALTKRTWTAWGDFHDGTFWNLNLTNAMADNVTNWVYSSYSPEGFSRWYIPGTTYGHEGQDGPDKKAVGMEPGVDLNCQDKDDQRLVYNRSSQEVWQAYGEEGNLEEPCDPDAQAYLRKQTWPIDEPGRRSIGGVIEKVVPTNLFKITYGVPNASKARDFATEVLGATDKECVFPYPPTKLEDGTPVNGAKWLYVNDWLQMHLVESGDEAQHARISEYHKLGESKAEHLRNGCLHAFFLNHIIFQVDTLDPFIDKLEERQVPYLATKNGNGDYALIFAFPGNEAVVIQLSSQHLTKASALPQSQVHENC